MIDAIRERRAYRSLDPIEVTGELIRDLAEAARLAPSCFNNQPWRFVFVHDREALEGVRPALSSGNELAKSASMIVAVVSRKDYDCVIKGREYYLFDTGMATALLILRATELGLVAHPIAGYDEGAVKGALGIPADMTVITLVIIGKRSGALSPLLSEKQAEAELRRPERLSLERFAFEDRFPVEG
ncbi:MAG: nitroreductase family protein [Candidatus Bathyarchaeia archaeon]